MMKHRTITGFAAVALLAVAATAAATVRVQLPSKNNPNACAGTSFEKLAGNVNKLATDDYDDQSLVFSAKRN